jgi:hypothetical protein
LEPNELKLQALQVASNDARDTAGYQADAEAVIKRAQIYWQFLNGPGPCATSRCVLMHNHEGEHAYT